ncbi:Hypothetical protein A7982_11208 [Minicystis rosea]|nr:Hypothetical protein A7982_11208 [Minicystis rosea]
MNLGAAAVVLRPRSLAEILDLACRLSCSLALGLYLRLAALVLLPCLALCLALRHVLDWSWYAVWFVAACLGAAAQGVFTIAVGRLLFSEALGAGQVIRLFARRFGSYLWMLVLSRVVLVGSAAVLIALPVAWPRLLFVHEASLLENAKAGDAIQRAGRFVSGRAAQVFGVLAALLVTQAGFIAIAEFLGHGLVDQVLQLGRPFGALFSKGGSAYALAGFFLSVPYVSTARFLHYIDARTRADGWDVQLRFMAIASENAERRAA